MSEQQNSCYNGEHYRDQTARAAIQRAEPTQTSGCGRRFIRPEQYFGPMVLT